jgi:hypothetical protein
VNFEANRNNNEEENAKKSFEPQILMGKKGSFLPISQGTFCNVKIFWKGQNLNFFNLGEEGGGGEKYRIF